MSATESFVQSVKSLNAEGFYTRAKEETSLVRDAKICDNR